MRNHLNDDGDDDFLPELDGERDPDEGESITPFLDELMAEEQSGAEPDSNGLLVPEESETPDAPPDLYNVQDTGLDLTQMRLPTSVWLSKYLN